jgi:hypothetical protein
MPQFNEIQQARAQHESALMRKPNVVGVGVSYKSVAGERSGELCMAVLVQQKLPKAGLSAEALVPQELDGVHTDVIQVGELRALQARTDRWRPARGGISLGHYQITAGTYGCTVRDKTSGVRLILSNNHVLANSNNANPGDPILQPGPADGGQPAQDTLAHLERFARIQFTEEPGSCSIAGNVAGIGNALARLLGSSHRLQTIRANPQAVNLVDAAVARPINDSDVLDEIIDLGTVTGTISAALGMAVRKSGRSTATTSGQVSVLEATVSISYGAGRSATFEKQIVTTAMSQGGDSGSLLMESSGSLAVGLLFGGSDQATIHNPIQAVLDSLDITFTVPVAAKGEAQVAVERAQAVRNAYQAELMKKPNVVGVGVGLRHTGGQRTDQVAVVVMVDRKVPLAQLRPQDRLPGEIDGVPVDVKEVGELRAQ